MRVPGSRAHLGDALDKIRLDGTCDLQLFYGFKVGERLNAIAPVDIEATDVLELLLHLVHQPTDDIRTSFEHSVLDAGHYRGRQQTGGLLVLGDPNPLFPADIQEEEHAEGDNQNADDQQGDLEREALTDFFQAFHGKLFARPSGAAAEQETM